MWFFWSFWLIFYLLLLKQTYQKNRSRKCGKLKNQQGIKYFLPSLYTSNGIVQKYPNNFFIPVQYKGLRVNTSFKCTECLHKYIVDNSLTLYYWYFSGKT
eukprot:GHVU01184925.1.p2 GENE.GHVU01184925.1~~GHVU01184925.1.p2  ORF type:complete len:100 (-),score=0.16 GHVU01184925.1:610-909(-)